MLLAESPLHPALAASVSRLSYEGRLRAHPCASDRELQGVEPGVHPVPVLHVGNATASPEEAETVVELVRDLVGRSWSDLEAHAQTTTRPSSAGSSTRAVPASDCPSTLARNGRAAQRAEDLATAGPVVLGLRSIVPQRAPHHLAQPRRRSRNHVVQQRLVGRGPGLSR